MNKYLVAIVALFAFCLPLTAQSTSSVALSSTDKKAIETSKAKLTALQKHGAVVQAGYDTELASLKWQFTISNKALQDAIEAAKQHLNLPSDAVFDQSTYTFTVPAKPAPPTPEAKK